MRVLSGVANLTSEYDCSSPFSFRDMTFFRFFKKISEILILFFFFFKNSSSHFCSGGCQRALRFAAVANLSSKCDGSNPCSFRDMMCFMISFFFSKNLDFDKFTRLQILNLVVG